MTKKPAGAKVLLVPQETDKMSLESGRWVRISDETIPLIIALLEDAGQIEPGAHPPPQLVANFFSEAAERWLHQAASYRKISW